MGLRLLVILTLLGVVAHGCIIKIPYKKRQQNYYDTLESKRKTYQGCTCGQYGSKNGPNIPWNLFVHVHGGEFNRTCMGTIVTSNLIATSHECLMLEDHPLRITDLLRLRVKRGTPPSTVSRDQILISSSSQDAAKPRSAYSFRLLEIIYNPQFVFSSEMNLYPENDLALLHVEADFTVHPVHHPVCIPWFYEDMRIGNVSGIYYGQTEHEVHGNLTTESDLPHAHFGNIYEKRLCYEHLNLQESEETKEESYNKTICFRFDQYESHERLPGGTLIYAPARDTKPANAFLLGIATEVPQMPASGFEASTGTYNAYASSMEALIKFIEYYAVKKGSLWCKTPKLEMKKTEGVITRRGTKFKWPWDDSGFVAQRDESLDCVCGYENHWPGEGQGRIAGGHETAPRRYGWMTIMHIYHDGKGRTSNLCGGAVIADRVILTAAHCLIADKKLKKRRPSVKPKNLEVYLNVHSARGDEHGVRVEIISVLYHPSFLHARLANPSYYDKDIALMILKEPLTFPKHKDPGIRPICLTKKGSEISPLVGRKVTVIGWGRTNPDVLNSLASHLQQVTLPIIELNRCRQVANTRIPDNFVCAGSLNRFKDAAGGDSGGPLMFLNETTHQWFELALVSWGENNGGKTAALYSDVQQLIDFVDFHTERVHAKWCKTAE